MTTVPSPPGRWKLRCSARANRSVRTPPDTRRTAASTNEKTPKALTVWVVAQPRRPPLASEYQGSSIVTNSSTRRPRRGAARRPGPATRASAGGGLRAPCPSVLERLQAREPAVHEVAHPHVDARV